MEIRDMRESVLLHDGNESRGVGRPANREVPLQLLWV